MSGFIVSKKMLKITTQSQKTPLYPLPKRRRCDIIALIKMYILYPAFVPATKDIDL